jgi:hypothetical protein
MLAQKPVRPLTIMLVKAELSQVDILDDDAGTTRIP